MNKPQSNSAQNPTNGQPPKKPTTPQLNPDFSHRLGVFDSEATALNLADSVYSLAKQADCVISMLQGQYVGDENVTKFSDGTTYWVLESIRLTVKDMDALVQAYHEAHRNAEAGQDGLPNHQTQKNPDN